MYRQFFGFTERPFKLVPNPDYLFLGKSHEEALAHLRYALTDGEGFVEIIGEIGTGKTMLCRAFLEGLGEDVASAYIFNPRMDALDLLKAVNDEFGISKDHDSIKALIDGLNAFLMDQKAAGKTVILLIDEAQNLSREVLEQIRLLSNLETTKDKLLQIILVGQPELAGILDSYELRQLEQRISLRCRLHPLTYAETKAYIAHRIQVAAGQPVTVFSASAIRRIYTFSKGIPRLINIACDRALLTAFGRHRRKVSGRIAKSAIMELSGQDDFRQTKTISMRLAVASVLGAAAIFLAGFFFNQYPWHAVPKYLSARTPVAVIEKGTSLSEPAPAIEARPVKPVAVITTSGAISDESVPKKQVHETTEIEDTNQALDFLKYLIRNVGIFSKTAAFESLGKAWGMDEISLADLPAIDDDPVFFRLAARQSGLVVTPVDDDLGRIIRLNVPAVLKFHPPSVRTPLYLTAIQATKDAVTFSGNDVLPDVSVPYDQIMESWSGRAFVFWKNFYNYQGIIPFDAPGESVITLKLHLRDIGYRHIDISGIYDPGTRMTIKAIQARHGIPIDGVVGPLTKIVLYNEKKSLAIPHLWEQMTLPDEIASMKIVQRTPTRE